MAKVAELKRGLAPMHPGEMLAEITLPALKAEGIGKGEFAERLGISRGMLEKLVTQASGVTPPMALRLATVLGTSAEMWMNLQAAYDLDRAKNALAMQLLQLRPIKLTKAA